MLVLAGGGRERLVAHFRGPRAFVGPLQLVAPLEPGHRERDREASSASRSPATRM